MPQQQQPKPPSFLKGRHREERAAQLPLVCLHAKSGLQAGRVLQRDSAAAGQRGVQHQGGDRGGVRAVKGKNNVRFLFFGDHIW